jgi:hypothetical protein
MDRAQVYARRYLRHAAFVLALALAASATRPAHALEPGDLTGWWIAIDETLPKLSRLGAIATMEEVIQIDTDGRVQDRALNFTGGDAQACLESKICSDSPAIATARVQVSGNHVNFTQVATTDAMLDSVAGTLLVRQEAVTATPEWTATLENDRLTLRAVGANKVRVLARVEPERLRKLYAGMRVSTWAANESWRCYLRTATGNDQAFAPLRGRRTYRPPEFLDRYLTLASYIAAVRSAASIPGRDETDEERRKLASVSAEASMVQPFDGVSRTPSAENRKRLNAVLAYIEEHTRALIASDEATAKATAAKAHAVTAAREQASREAAAKSTAAAADEAEAKVAAMQPDDERLQATAASQAKVVNEARAAGQEAETLATLKQSASGAAGTAADTIRRLALIQHRTSRIARNYAADQQQRHEAALRSVAEQQQKALEAKTAAKAQQEKVTAAAAAADEAQRKADVARLAAEKARRKLESAKSAVTVQQQKIDVIAATVRAFAEVVTAAQKTADEATAAVQDKARPAPAIAAAHGGDPASEAQRSALQNAQQEAATAASALQDAVKSAVATRDRAAAESQSAAERMTELQRAVQAAEQQATDALQAADTAQSVADQAKTDADAVAREAHRFVIMAQDAEARIAEASDATKATEAARNVSENEAQAEAQQAASLSASADRLTKSAQDTLGGVQTAVAARGRAVGVLNEIGAEADRWIAEAKKSAEAMTAARHAASTARAAAQAAAAQRDLATQASTKAATEAQAAIEAETAASEALKAAAAKQPQDDPTVAAITEADIAALARVVSDSDDAQRLFCRGRYASRTAPAAAHSSPAPTRAQPAAAAAPVAVPTPRRAPETAEPQTKSQAAPVHEAKPAREVPKRVSRPAKESKAKKDTKKESKSESKKETKKESKKDSKPAKETKKRR